MGHQKVQWRSLGRFARRGRRFIGALPAQFEALESRRLFSAGVIVSDGILTITGSDHADDIRIYRDRGNPTELDVSIRQLYEMNVMPQPPVPGSGSYDLASIRGIRVNGMGGDDAVYIFNSPDEPSENWTTAVFDDYGKLNIPATLDGGAGDDNLYSESNADDVIIGGAGRDHAFVVDGHDQFSVEYIENYRDIIGWSGGTGVFNPFGGSFAWNGPEDQLFPDPWLVPNRQGTYFGPNAPHFEDPVVPDTVVVPDGTVINDQSSDVTSHSGTVNPTKTSAPPLVVMTPLVVFSTTTVQGSERALWDDSHGLF